MDDFIKYRNALNNNYTNYNITYDKYEIKYLLSLGKKVEIIEVKKYEYSDKNTEKLIVNGVIPIYLGWRKTFRGVDDGAKYGVYVDKNDVLADIVEYYKIKKLLLKKYKKNYDNTLKYIKDIEEVMKGNEEYMI